jgi:VanZ family protein
MRILLIILWAGLLFILTCTTSIELLFQQQRLLFQWNSSPSFSEFFSPLPSELSEAFITRKIGHSLSFFILTVLMLSRISLKYAFVASLVIAAMTEILQLFFQRDGRLFDIGFDSLGIILAILLAGVIKLIFIMEARVKKWFFG